MLVLQSGLPKSGNLWLHKILQESIRLGGGEIKSYIQTQPIFQEAKNWPGFSEQAGIDFIEVDAKGVFLRKGAFRQSISDLDGYLSQCTHVWTHALWIPRCDGIFNKFEKIVYIVRDPRDVAVSASKYFFTPFMLEQHPQQEPDASAFLKHRLYEQVLTWVQHVGGYLLHAENYRLHFIFYERLLQDFDAEYQRLLEYLEIPLSASAISEVRESTRFENMKKQNPHHLRKGESGGWAKVLTNFQVQQVTKMAGPMMEILGYPLTEPVSAAFPTIVSPLDGAQIRQAISAARGGLPENLQYAWAFATSRRPLSEKIKKGIQYLQKKGRWSLDP
jgi:aryl sulfotransferase